MRFILSVSVSAAAAVVVIAPAAEDGDADMLCIGSNYPQMEVSKTACLWWLES